MTDVLSYAIGLAFYIMKRKASVLFRHALFYLYVVTYPPASTSEWNMGQFPKKNCDEGSGEVKSHLISSSFYSS